MGPFDSTKDPRKPRAPRGSGDNVPLLPVRRRSRKQNTWNDDDEYNAELDSLRRRSSEAFHRFLEYSENEEDASRTSAENGGYRVSEDHGLARASIDDPQSVGPLTKPSNLSRCCDPALQNHCC